MTKLMNNCKEYDGKPLKFSTQKTSKFQGNKFLQVYCDILAVDNELIQVYSFFKRTRINANQQKAFN